MLQFKCTTFTKNVIYLKVAALILLQHRISSVLPFSISEKTVEITKKESPIPTLHLNLQMDVRKQFISTNEASV